MQITTLGLDLAKNVFQVHGPAKKPGSLCLVGSLRTPYRCPRSDWNAVRLQRGTVSAITAECCPPSQRNSVRDRAEYALFSSTHSTSA